MEDDPSIRTSLELSLQFDGFHVLLAEHGREALNVLRAGAGYPDIILLDLMMPVMDGWEFLREKNADPDMSPIPVVIMSAATPAMFPTTGITAALQKPFEMDTFLDIVRRVQSAP